MSSLLNLLKAEPAMVAGLCQAGLGIGLALGLTLTAGETGALEAAAACGLRTAHTARVNEYGPSTGEPSPTVPVDYAAADLAALADKLGV